MTELFDILLSASFWAATVRIASPLIFATMGELICERAGVLNLGIEGIMVVGAFTGWLAVYQGATLWAGVGVAALAGAGAEVDDVIGLADDLLLVLDDDDRGLHLRQEPLDLGLDPAQAFGHRSRLLRPQHARREQARRGARPRAALRPAGARQDYARLHRGRSDGCEYPVHVRPGH